ncbi:MAG: plastocyanin/azurin family copper-binding protein [Nitrosopumilus sp.]|nr:plastocyanin/azurin family copper-binding protein [Nitrosopumilus sp.]MDF2423673.1 plastocyanin/azurin family copper-binding protein [Nitrosopumilus sp.]MDF2425427.1 plastocyanin/azurin family copper-binding protein [Nitrosopumilus sp.]MDF2427616.1 plastocyanin/azurin family copper-binding protein [Nitrosopumilus sp.]MDF2427903.1 plastocyanin/azurin family copper-binding protein [Nitrosopumilus sp.]
MSVSTSSHAYGIGMIALIIGMSASVIFYTSFYLPESLTKPSVSEQILNPEEIFFIEIVPGAVVDGNPNYVPNKPTVLLSINNKVIWQNNDDTAHTVTPDHRSEDSYSGEFGSPGVIKPGETYEFLFTEPQDVPYYCAPHPWMQGTISVEKSRF